MPVLIFRQGTPKARVFELKPGDNYLGRGESNEVSLDDSSVSDRHALITLDGDTAILTDLDSTNGTRVNGFPAMEVTLKFGQTLEVGTVELLYASAAPEPVIKQAPEPPAKPRVRLRVETGGSGAISILPATQPAAPTSVPTIPASGGQIAVGGSRPFNIPLPPPPAPVAATTPVPPPIPAAKPAARPNDRGACRYHPKTPGRWLCPQCGHHYCDLCVGPRRTADGGTGYFCRPCGAQCSPATPRADVNPLSELSFYALLPGAFAYPFQRGGGFLLFCGTVFFVIVGFLSSYSLFFELIFLGYLFAYMQNVVNTTAMGDESEASLPDFSNFQEDILQPCFQLLGAVVICFGPAIGLAIWSYMSNDRIIGLCALPALALGCVYFPMGFLAVSMLDTVSALSPILIFPAIIKAPLEYIVACVMLAAVFAARWLGHEVLPWLIPVPILPSVLSSFVGLYFLTVECRILGLFYYANKYKLGWFRH